MPVKSLLNSRLDQTVFEFSNEFSKDLFAFQLPLGLTHRDSGFNFIVDFETGEWDMPYFTVQSFPSTNYENRLMYVGDWDEVMRQFDSWLEKVRKELSQPDSWLLLNEGKVLTDSIPSAGASLERFNDEELSRVTGLLDSIRGLLISEARPTEDQLKLIDEKLSYLGESAKRQNKQDWAHTAIGVVVTIAIGLAMAPDQANKLFQLSSALLRAIFLKTINNIRDLVTYAKRQTRNHFRCRQ